MRLLGYKTLLRFQGFLEYLLFRACGLICGERFNLVFFSVFTRASEPFQFLKKENGFLKFKIIGDARQNLLVKTEII